MWPSLVQIILQSSQITCQFHGKEVLTEAGFIYICITSNRLRDSTPWDYHCIRDTINYAA